MHNRCIRETAESFSILNDTLHFSALYNSSSTQIMFCLFVSASGSSVLMELYLPETEMAFSLCSAVVLFHASEKSPWDSQFLSSS